MAVSVSHCVAMVYKRPSRAGQEGVSGVRRSGISSYALQSELLAKTIKENTALKKANLIIKKQSLKQISIAKAMEKRMNRQLAINKDNDRFKAEHTIQMEWVNDTLCSMQLKWNDKFGDDEGP